MAKPVQTENIFRHIKYILYVYCWSAEVSIKNDIHSGEKKLVLLRFVACAHIMPDDQICHMVNSPHYVIYAQFYCTRILYI